jgi:hypothetical protein
VAFAVAAVSGVVSVAPSVLTVVVGPIATTAGLSVTSVGHRCVGGGEAMSSARTQRTRQLGGRSDWKCSNDVCCNVKFRGQVRLRQGAGVGPDPHSSASIRELAALTLTLLCITLLHRTFTPYLKVEMQAKHAFHGFPFLVCTTPSHNLNNMLHNAGAILWSFLIVLTGTGNSAALLWYAPRFSQWPHSSSTQQSGALTTYPSLYTLYPLHTTFVQRQSHRRSQHGSILYYLREDDDRIPRNREGLVISEMLPQPREQCTLDGTGREECPLGVGCSDAVGLEIP